MSERDTFGMKPTGKKLEGRVALVTGGSAGIGLATARRFVEEGAQVFITGRDQMKLDSAVLVVGKNSVGIRADSADLKALEFVFDQIKRKAGRLDVLVLNAGIYPVGPTESVSDTDLDALLNVNIRAPHVLVGALAPAMADRGRGTIIVITSWMALVGTPDSAIYTATKAADEQLARSWAAEYGPRGVRVNALAPGVTLTPGNAAYREALDAMTAATPKGNIVTPDQIADGAAFLASQQAAALHGSTLLMDGGMTTTRLSGAGRREEPTSPEGDH